MFITKTKIRVILLLLRADAMEAELLFFSLVARDVGDIEEATAPLLVPYSGDLGGCY